MAEHTPPPHPDRSPFAAGPVVATRLDPGVPPPAYPGLDVIAHDPPRRRLLAGQPPLRRYVLVAGGVLVLGLAVLLVLVLNGQLGNGHGLLSRSAQQPPDLRPPLAKLCPAPSAAPPAPRNGTEPDPTGPRSVDEKAGISYGAYGAPWVTWPYVWRLGTLQVPYAVGQHFITETYIQGDYHASILSAAVPATVNDSTLIDIQCVGQQVAADVRAEYYPQPNTMDLMRQGATTLDGHQAWESKFRLHFSEPGLKAKSELVGVVLIDVGKPTAAVLYVSIPDTNPEWDYVVDDVVASVRVL